MQNFIQNKIKYHLNSPLSRIAARARDFPLGNKKYPLPGIFFMVDPSGIEPLTSSMPWKRSTS
jgi:hypothetical protein